MAEFLLWEWLPAGPGSDALSVFFLVRGWPAASVLGLLEAKESSARERAERLRSELEDAEREVERLVTAREMVSQVLSQTQETGLQEAVACPDAPRVAPKRGSELGAFHLASILIWARR
ncbi:hypothetical protein ACWCOW_39360 [Streptomyces sp. NPDC001939]